MSFTASARLRLPREINTPFLRPALRIVDPDDYVYSPTSPYWLSRADVGQYVRYLGQKCLDQRWYGPAKQPEGKARLLEGMKLAFPEAFERKPSAEWFQTLWSMADLPSEPPCMRAMVPTNMRGWAEHRAWCIWRDNAEDDLRDLVRAEQEAERLRQEQEDEEEEKNSDDDEVEIIE